MTLTDLLKLFYTGWRLILGVLLISLVTAGIYLATTPSQYEATLLIKVGQTGYVENTQFDAKPYPLQIQNDDDARYLMSGTEFKNSVIDSLGWRDEARVRLLQSSFQVSSTASGHLKITVRGLSSADARQAVEASLVVIGDIHNGLLDKFAAKRAQELARIQADIVDAKGHFMDLERIGKSSAQHGLEVAVLNWLANINEQKYRIRVLQMRQFALMEAATDLTSRTMAVEAPFVSDRSVHPKVHRVWLFAVFIGLLLGSVFVILRSITREPGGGGP